MAPPAAVALGRRLRRLDRARLSRFVAALWAATGWSTAIRDGRVVARRHDPATERTALAVVSGRSGVARALVSPPAAADRLVAPVGARAGRALTARTGLPVVDAATLHERLTYAVDADTREHLLDEHVPGPRSTTGRRAVLSSLAVGAGALLAGAVAPSSTPRRGRATADGDPADGAFPDRPVPLAVDQVASPPPPPGTTPTRVRETGDATATVGCDGGPRAALVDQIAALRRELAVASGTVPEAERPVGYDFAEATGAFVRAVRAADVEPFRDADWVRIERALGRGGQSRIPVVVRTSAGEVVHYEFTMTATAGGCWRTAGARVVSRRPVDPERTDRRLGQL